MAVESGDFLVQSAIYLGAAAVTVPVFHRFRLGSILGYIAAGIAVGPFGLNLLRQGEGVYHIAELGVVLFLFIIGLELSASRLWSMRRHIVGLGGTQMILTSLVIGGLLFIAGIMPPEVAAMAGVSLAFSSTALVLQLMRDRNELHTAHGTRSFSILLFQDIAVIPALVAIPFVAGGHVDGAAGWTGALKGAGVVAALIIAGRFALDRIFHLVAGSGSREAFAATALLVVAMTALAVSSVGLSMELGAFLAGVILAESSYRHQIETDIEPFRGLLLGLFFISIGMRLDFDVILENWLAVSAGAVVLVLLKSGLLYAILRTAGSDRKTALKTGGLLCQGGEFAFVMISLGISSMLFTDAQGTIMSAIVTISMMLTPAVVMVVSFSGRGRADSGEDIDRPGGDSDHVIVAGFGRVGQIVSQVLMNAGIRVTAIDRNAEHIRNAQRFGFKVYFGDASRLDLLISAGVFRAKAIVLCMDDIRSVNRAVEILDAVGPGLTVIACAHDRVHEMELRRLQADVIVRETLESSLEIARRTLVRTGHGESTVEDYIQQFRKMDRERLLAQIDGGMEAGSAFLQGGFSKKEPAD